VLASDLEDVCMPDATVDEDSYVGRSSTDVSLDHAQILLFTF
jgi:hypothetical protein